VISLAEMEVESTPRAGTGRSRCLGNGRRTGKTQELGRRQARGIDADNSSSKDSETLVEPIDGRTLVSYLSCHIHKGPLGTVDTLNMHPTCNKSHKPPQTPVINNIELYNSQATRHARLDVASARHLGSFRVMDSKMAPSEAQTSPS
jgi:hypothetical protein